MELRISAINWTLTLCLQNFSQIEVSKFSYKVYQKLITFCFYLLRSLICFGCVECFQIKNEGQGTKIVTFSSKVATNGFLSSMPTSSIYVVLHSNCFYSLIIVFCQQTSWFIWFSFVHKLRKKSAWDKKKVTQRVCLKCVT